MMNADSWSCGSGRSGLRARHPQDVMRFGRQRNPHLFAVDHIRVAVAPRGGAPCRPRRCPTPGSVSPNMAIFLALRLRHEESLLLLLGAPLQQRQTVQSHVHRHHHAQAGVHRFQFFAHQPERDVIKALPAVFLRNANAQDAQLAHARQECSGASLLAVCLFDDRRDLFLAKVAHHLLHHVVLFGESEIHGVSPMTGQAIMTSMPPAAQTPSQNKDR